MHTPLGAHLNLRESMVFYSPNPINSSLETKIPWISGLTSRGAFMGSTVLHVDLTLTNRIE